MKGREPKQLVCARPDDDLLKVVGTLFQNKCSMAPILSSESGASGQEVRTYQQLYGAVNTEEAS